MAHQTRGFIAGVIATVVLLVAGAALVVFTGMYDVAADTPHWPVTAKLIAAAREEAIEDRAADVSVPPLNDPRMIAAGASHYDAMCTGCHLAPGMEENEMRPGMNPKPPVLWRMRDGDAREEFWIIKHGIRMTGMPAWGVTHSDNEIWDMVAFLQKLPQLSPAQYRATVVSGGEHHDEDHMDMH